MSQGNLSAPSIVAASTSGTALAAMLTTWRGAMHSQHGGSSEPSYKEAGLIWADTTSTTWLVKQYDGGAWTPFYYYDTVNNLIYPAKQHPRYDYPLAAGSASAMTLTLAPAIAAYNDGEVFTFEAPANNSGALTLNINSVGAKKVFKIVAGAGTALAANDIRQGGRYTVNYDSALDSAAGAFVLVQPSLDLSSLSGVIANSQLPDRLTESSGTAIVPGTGTTNGFHAAGKGSGWYTAGGGASGNPNGTDGFIHLYIRYSSSYGVNIAWAPASNVRYTRYWDSGTWTGWSTMQETAAQVDARADASLLVGYGAVASYALLYDSNGGYGEGGTVGGSGITPAGFANNTSSIPSDGTNGETRGTQGGSAESGTWRRHHRSNTSGTAARIGLYFRIS